MANDNGEEKNKKDAYYNLSTIDKLKRKRLEDQYEIEKQTGGYVDEDKEQYIRSRMHGF